MSVLICLLIFELIRRRRLMERYAILWLLAGVTVVVLSLGQDLLVKLDACGRDLLRALGRLRDRVPVRAGDARAVLDRRSRASLTRTRLSPSDSRCCRSASSRERRAGCRTRRSPLLEQILTEVGIGTAIRHRLGSHEHLVAELVSSEVHQPRRPRAHGSEHRRSGTDFGGRLWGRSRCRANVPRVSRSRVHRDRHRPRTRTPVWWRSCPGRVSQH